MKINLNNIDTSKPYRMTYPRKLDRLIILLYDLDIIKDYSQVLIN